MCTVHGPGARSKWRPIRTRVVGDDGVPRYEVTRLYYYECDVGPRGRGRFRQARLSSYVKTTPKMK